MDEQECLYKKQYEAIKAALDEHHRVFVADPEKWNDDNISENEILDGCDWCWINIDTITGTEEVKCVGAERLLSDGSPYYSVYYVPEFGGLEDTDLSNVSRCSLIDIIEMFNSKIIKKMANDCFTDYIIEGDKKEIQSLYEALQRVDTKADLKTTSGFGGRWLGNLVTELGEDWEKVYCRGSIEWYEMEDDQLKITTDTAWVPMNEVFDFICEKFPGLEYYYQAEEPGCDLFWSNDIEGLHFYKYLVRLCKDGYDECEYFETQEEAFEYISKNFNTVVKSITDVEDLNERLEEKENDDYCYLNEFIKPN